MNRYPISVDFADGSKHTATVQFTNPKARPITFTARLFLALSTDINTPVTNTLTQTFSVAANGTKNVTFSNVEIPLITTEVDSITLVSVIQVLYNNAVIQTFYGSDPVNAVFTPGIGWGDIIWT